MNELNKAGRTIDRRRKDTQEERKMMKGKDKRTSEWMKE